VVVRIVLMSLVHPAVTPCFAAIATNIDYARRSAGVNDQPFRAGCPAISSVEVTGATTAPSAPEDSRIRSATYTFAGGMIRHHVFLTCACGPFSVGSTGRERRGRRSWHVRPA
jgi:hypothetical protein